MNGMKLHFQKERLLYGEMYIIVNSIDYFDLFLYFFLLYFFLFVLSNRLIAYVYIYLQLWKISKSKNNKQIMTT